MPKPELIIELFELGKKEILKSFYCVNYNVIGFSLIEITGFFENTFYHYFKNFFNKDKYGRDKVLSKLIWSFLRDNIMVIVFDSHERYIDINISKVKIAKIGHIIEQTNNENPMIVFICPDVNSLEKFITMYWGSSFFINIYLVQSKKCNTINDIFNRNLFCEDGRLGCDLFSDCDFIIEGYPDGEGFSIFSTHEKSKLKDFLVKNIKNTGVSLNA